MATFKIFKDLQLSLVKRWSQSVISKQFESDSLLTKALYNVALKKNLTLQLGFELSEDSTVLNPMDLEARCMAHINKPAH